MNSIPQRARAEFTSWLRWRLDALLRGRLPEAAPGMFSITLELPGSDPVALSILREGDFYWSHPETGSRLLGRGLALTHTGDGVGSLGGLCSGFRRLRARWRHLDADGCGAQPLMFTGFAFDREDPMEGAWAGFPNCGLFLPELLLRQQGDSCRLVLSCRDGLLDVRRQVARWMELLAPLLDPPRERPAAPPHFHANQAASPTDAQWLDLGRDALEAIAQGTVEKLVLYRHLHLPPSSRLSVHALAAAMEGAYPGCRLFATVCNGRTLVSASPERLVEKRGLRVSTDVLAGTAPRSSDALRDQGLAQTLCQSRKERLEHRLVEEAVTTALAPLCNDVRVDTTPVVKRLRNVQHLWSQVQGELSGSVSLLDVAARLHPTPAVGGSPTQPALDWLRRHGQARRGWYCGGGGWIDRDGDGELSVLLRCALLGDSGAELFAGAGLVQGSEPRAELAETDLKLAAVLDLLGGVWSQA